MVYEICYLVISLFPNTQLITIAAAPSLRKTGLDLHHLVPLDCIESKGDTSFLFTADNPDKLEEVIKKIENMTLNEYNYHAIKSRDFAINLYSPVSKDKLKSLIFNTQSS